MKKIKLLFTVFMLALSTSFVFAQEKLEEKAQTQVKEMKAKLETAKVDALTIEQEKSLTAIYLEKFKKMKEIKNEETDEAVQKEKIKELHKEYAKKIQAVLTKEQKAGLKALKDN